MIPTTASVYRKTGLAKTTMGPGAAKETTML